MKHYVNVDVGVDLIFDHKPTHEEILKKAQEEITTKGFDPELCRYEVQEE